MATQTPRNCGLLFPFYEPLQLLQTRPFDYASLIKQGPAAPQLASLVRPDFLAELSFHRGSVASWLQSLSSGTNNAAAATAPAVPDVAVESLAALAARLHGLVLTVGSPPGTGGATTGGDGGAGGAAAATAAGAAVSLAAAITMNLVRTEWSSALSRRPQRMFRLDCLPQDLAMVYSAYGAALRLAALQRCSGAANAEAQSGSATASEEAAAAAAPEDGGGGGGGGSPSSPERGGSGPQAALTAAVAGLRRAAGVYEYLAEGLLPALSGAGAVGVGDRPLELLPAAARCMQLLCLAEGQALVAAAAEARAMSAGTQRALHAGCAALFHQAAAVAPGWLPSSERLARLLPAAAALHSARAALCVARERQVALELGEAEAACEECRKSLDAAARVLDRRSDPASWLGLIQAEQAPLAALLTAVQRDRLAVTFQPVPKQPPDVTAAPAVRVAADTFRPEPQMPPAPPAEAQDKGSCIVM